MQQVGLVVLGKMMRMAHQVQPTPVMAVEEPELVWPEMVDQG